MAKALMTFQASVAGIKLSKEVKIATKTGREIRFNYAPLADIMAAVRQPMKDAGLAFSQLLAPGQLTTLLMCVEDGTYIQSVMPLQMSGDPKDIGQLITYFKRYSLAAILGIAGEEDSDASNMDGVNIKQNKAMMTPALLDKALTRIGEGEEGVLEMCEEHFSLTQSQRNTLEKAIAKKLKDGVS